MDQLKDCPRRWLDRIITKLKNPGYQVKVYVLTACVRVIGYLLKLIKGQLTLVLPNTYPEQVLQLLYNICARLYHSPLGRCPAVGERGIIRGTSGFKDQCVRCAAFLPILFPRPLL